VSCNVVRLRLTHLPIVFSPLPPLGICLGKYSRLDPFQLVRLAGIQSALPGEKERCDEVTP
jgi:hypothetical protein